MNLNLKLGGKERVFGLLSMDDLRSIMATMPNPTGDIIELRSLDRWSKNPDGCEQFIYYALRKAEPQVTREQIRGWGSLLARINLASELFTASITSGEEDPTPNAAGGEAAAAPVTPPPIGS